MTIEKLRVAFVAFAFFVGGLAGPAAAEIPKPADAPPPLSPAESLAKVTLPRGFRLELIASEPLVREPSGVCWDERGRMFVCELHGYNLEGQYDIEELNKTGKLDRVVRRIQANEQAKQKAAAGTYGTVKLLVDRDGDGQFDAAEVWADRLPPCYGICPARGGIIVVCAPDIVFLADRDGDGKAEVRETLFTGFATGPLERGVNCPIWGVDNWIYIGGGHSGGKITGPHLAGSVELPNSDFRIKADGSAIEPVPGRTHTIGHTMTAAGERFVTSTGTPGIFVAPIEWRYLARNPDVATGSLEMNAADDQKAYPTSQPHPWRTRRADDPGFSKYYTDRYGVAESAPNGYLTSACSPLVYQGSELFGLDGQLLTCEPAQNFVHRSLIVRDGVALRLTREKTESQREFLASSDPWFHPISLAIAPDGTVCVVDFYREIIEDYSAIPRYLQQQYGLVAGREHGRLWRLTNVFATKNDSIDMSKLSAAELVAEVKSKNFWRRRTAQRLLVEKQDKSVTRDLSLLARESKRLEPVLAALYALDGLGTLAAYDVSAALDHENPAVRVHGLRLGERFLNSRREVIEKTLELIDDKAAEVRLQAVLSAGECKEPALNLATAAMLAGAAREHGAERWMDTAILSSLAGRAGICLSMILTQPDKLGQAELLVESLSRAVAARGDSTELSASINTIARCRLPDVRTKCLRGLAAGANRSADIKLSDDARELLKRLATEDGIEETTHSLARELIRTLHVESPAERTARIAASTTRLSDVQLTAGDRLAALADVAEEDDPAVTQALIAAVPSSTPQLRDAVLKSLFARGDRLAAVLDALEKQTIAAASLDAVQRTALVEHRDAAIRSRAAKLFAALPGVDDALLAKFVSALDGQRDLAAGEVVFRNKCATCHQAHGVGVAVGPDLTAEFQRAESTIVKDILAPSDTISAGYTAYAIETMDGEVLNGLLTSESASSLTLRMSEGKDATVLRKDVDRIKALGVSLMPENLAKELSPKQVADAIAWLRQPPDVLVLVDENRGLEQTLNEGAGTATFVADDPFAGNVALRITPPQRYSPQIKGWQFRIREKPGPGEFRYLRLAWKSAGATGVMLELANEGHWPDAGSPKFRYVAGENSTGWQATRVAAAAPGEWTVVERDLWKDFGDATITGIAPTAMGGSALFDRLELRRTRFEE
ncbi:MAG: PVC-type heme-binding CxxCH protein [Pirellulales bacterium]